MDLGLQHPHPHYRNKRVRASFGSSISHCREFIGQFRWTELSLQADYLLCCAYIFSATASVQMDCRQQHLSNLITI
jgi:hypothetical protein